MIFSQEVIKAAHLHSSKHRAEICASEKCGCFHCGFIFEPAEISIWLSELVDELSEEDTALCPKCGIDSVLGSESGYPVSSPDFLKDMRTYWFERTVHA